MRKFFIFAIMLAVSVALAQPCVGAEKKIRDNDGNVWIIDTATKATPGAGSGEGAIIGAASDTLPAYDNHKFDLQIGVNAIGSAADDSSGTEALLTGATLYWRPASWFRVGPSLNWNTADTQKFTLSVPVGFALFPNPWSGVRWWLTANVLPSYTMRTSLDPAEPRENAWTWAPAAEFAVEFPMQLWSVEVGLGAAYPFTIEGVDDSAVNSAIEKVALGANVAVNWRLGR